MILDGFDLENLTSTFLEKVKKSKIIFEKYGDDFSIYSNDIEDLKKFFLELSKNIRNKVNEAIKNKDNLITLRLELSDIYYLLSIFNNDLEDFLISKGINMDIIKRKLTYNLKISNSYVSNTDINNTLVADEIYMTEKFLVEKVKIIKAIIETILGFVKSVSYILSEKNEKF